MNYQDYIKSELLILIPVLYFVGIGLKKSKVADRLIPSIIGLVSVILSAAWVISTGDVNGIKEIAFALFTAVTQGVLVAGATVYVNQLYVQSNKEE